MYFALCIGGKEFEGEGKFPHIFFRARCSKKYRHSPNLPCKSAFSRLYVTFNITFNFSTCFQHFQQIFHSSNTSKNTIQKLFNIFQQTFNNTFNTVNHAFKPFIALFNTFNAPTITTIFFY